MRCALCRNGNPEDLGDCRECGARLTEQSHREIWGINYLLGQIGKWREEHRLPTTLLLRMRGEYISKREAIKEELRPPVIEIVKEAPVPAPAPVPEPPPPPPPASEPEPAVIHEIVPVEPPKPRPRPEPVRPPRPPRPPFSFKNLFTEQNIRWILNLGIFIFSVGLVVFIHTQWKEMASGLKISILFGASFAAMGAGHFMRGTILKATGTALVMLGAIAVPIDCAALIPFKLVSPDLREEIGLAGSILSLLLYLGLARIYSERYFVHLATLAAGSTWAFFLSVCGVGWSAIVPWIAPAALVGTLLRWRPVRLMSYGVLGASVLTALGFLAFGLLGVRADGLSLEVALGTAAIASWLAGRKLMRPAFSWLTVAWLGAMFAVGAGWAQWTPAQSAIPLAVLGAVFGLGWSKKSLPFMTGSAVAGLASIVLCGWDPTRLAVVFAIPAAVHVAYGWYRDGREHMYAGALLAGGALVMTLQALDVSRLYQPVFFAVYGAVLVQLGRYRTRDVFHEVGALAAGAAMFLFALWYMDYYQAGPGGGRSPQILGSLVAALAALPFGMIANRIRSRYVSDITYGCMGFAYILLLRWCHVPGAWLGLSMAGFGAVYILLEKKISRWLMRPTLFTGVAATTGATIFALVQWQITHQYLPASLTLLLIGGFYLAVARKTPYTWLSHVGVYLAAAGWIAGLQFLGLKIYLPDDRFAFLTFIPAAAAIVVAVRLRDRHLGLANLAVAIAAMAFMFLDPAMYHRGNLPTLASAALLGATVTGWFAFRKEELRGVDVRLMSGLMGLFAAVAYLFTLWPHSTGRPWSALVVFLMSAAMVVAAEVLRRRGWHRQAWPLVWVSTLVTLVAAYRGHWRGWDEGAHLCIYALAMALYAGAAYTFRRRGFAWVSAFAGVIAVGFALIRGFLEGEQIQAVLTLAPVGAFTLGASYVTRFRWIAHPGIYVMAGAGWLLLLGLDVLYEARSMFLFLPAAAGLMAAAWRRQLHPSVACLAVAVSALAFAYVDPRMYTESALPFTISISIGAAALAGWFAYSRGQVPGVDPRLMSGISGLFAAAAWVLRVRQEWWDEAWAGIAVFGMSAALGLVADIMRRRGRIEKAWPLIVDAIIVSAGAFILAVVRGFDDGMHVWVCLLALGLYTLLGRSFRRIEFSWAGALSGAAGVVFLLLHFDSFNWAGVCLFPAAALALQDREKPLRALGYFIALIAPLDAAVQLHGEAWTSLVFVGMAALLALTRLRLLSFFPMALAVVISFGQPPFDSLAPFAGFALYCGLGLALRKPYLLYASLVLALLGDFGLAEGMREHAGLWALPLAFVLFGMAWEVTKRFGREFGWPMLGAAFAAGLLAAVLGFDSPGDRIFIFLGNALLYGAAAALFRRPELVYPCSAALVALDMALMDYFTFPPRTIAFQLLMLALAKVILVRSLGDRLRAYLQPIFIASLVVAAGVLAYGGTEYRAFVDREGDINLAIWGFLLLAAIAGVAGRIRKIPVFVYLAAANLMASYYLTIHKYEIAALEFKTVPVGIGLLIWSGLALREKRLRTVIEGLAVAVFFLPSAIQSFIPEENVHTLAALALAFLTVLAGMVMKSRVLLFGATGAFVAEVLGKAIHFLVLQELSVAEWGMVVGGLLILLAAAFESRKAPFVRARAEWLAARARHYFTTWQ